MLSQPTTGTAWIAGPHGVVGILGDLHMMRTKAHVNQLELLGCRIIDGEVATAALEGKELRRGMARSLSTEGRGLRRTDGVGHPDSSLVIHHRVVEAGPPRPDDFFPVVGRGLEQRLWVRKRRIRIANRRRDPHHGVARRIQDIHIRSAELLKTVHEAVRVQGGIPPVG